LRGQFNRHNSLVGFDCLFFWKWENKMDDTWRNATKWLAIQGNWQFPKPGLTIYDNLDGEARSYGICITGERPSDVEISVTVNFETYEDGRILLGYRSIGNEYYAVGFGGYNDSCSLTHYSSSVGWSRLHGIGKTNDFEKNKDHVLKVNVYGQKLTCDINDIRAFEQILPAPVPAGNLGVFSWGACKTKYSNFKSRSLRGKGDAFIVMPFEGFADLYTDVIQPVTAEFGLNPIRGDEMYSTGVIMDDIISQIEKSQVIIAEITTQTKMYSMR
jgi:hypothetical protein